MRKAHWIPFLMILLSFACTKEQNSTSTHMVYSTSSDSTMYYYNLGWQQIMDYGDYSKAEDSYRKALTFDDEFLVGKSVLARLTQDLDERLALFEELEKKKDLIVGEERKVLDVYIALTKFTNLRQQKSEQAQNALEEARQLGELNFRTVVYKYWDEVYLKSEYIEMLHSNYGAKQTLDSMDVLISQDQLTNPFLLGYKAILKAEIEEYDEAILLAQQLAKQLDGLAIAKPDAILADIYFKMEDFDTAKIHADKANKIDPNNLDASRLKVKIDQAIIDLKGN